MTSESTTNAGGGTTVISINSSVSVAGPYVGSTPSGPKADTLIDLTLDRSLDLGLRYNLGAISQSQAVREAQAQRRLALSTLLPNLNTVINETVQQINLRTQGVLESSFPIAVGPYNFFDARAAKLNQSVLDLVRLRNLRTATENVTANLESARDARDLVVLAVAGTYLQTIAISARIVAAQAQVETSRAVYMQATDRMNAGLNPRIDATRSQVQLQTDQERLRSLRADLDRQKLALARLIGLALGQQFTIAEDFPYKPLDLSLDQALSNAYQNRSDLKAAAASVRGAESAVKAARAERLPNLTLTADYGAAGLRPTAESHGVFTVTGTLTIPLYEGGRVGAEIQQANAVLQERKAEFEDVRGRVDQDIRTAFIDLNLAADEVKVAQSNVALAHDTLDQSRDRFTAGVADTVEFVQAQQIVVQAENDYITAVFQHNLAKVSLARAVGGAEQAIKQFLVK